MVSAKVNQTIWKALVIVFMIEDQTIQRLSRRQLILPTKTSRGHRRSELVIPDHSGDRDKR